MRKNCRGGLFQKVEKRGQVQHPGGSIQSRLAGRLGLRKIRGHRSQIRTCKAIFLLAQVQLSSPPEIRERSRRSSHRPGLVPVRDAPPEAPRRFHVVFGFFLLRPHRYPTSHPKFPVQAAFQRLFLAPCFRADLVLSLLFFSQVTSPLFSSIRRSSFHFLVALRHPQSARVFALSFQLGILASFRYNVFSLL